MATIKEYEAETADILIADTITIGTGQILADTINKDNAGIDAPTNQNQVC